MEHSDPKRYQSIRGIHLSIPEKEEIFSQLLKIDSIKITKRSTTVEKLQFTHDFKHTLSSNSRFMLTFL